MTEPADGSPFSPEVPRASAPERILEHLPQHPPAAVPGVLVQVAGASMLFTLPRQRAL